MNVILSIFVTFQDTSTQICTNVVMVMPWPSTKQQNIISVVEKSCMMIKNKVAAQVDHWNRLNLTTQVLRHAVMVSGVYTVNPPSV